ncbi:MAG: sigma-70 family RNA polymerase sigma factor [Alphaproteobacteria bacterium]|nr:sigma-70 family RNA polymerase sigma factor [Alphaproteobacteria bacterium]
MTAPVANPADAELVARALKGDRSAFDVFVRRHQEPLYRFVRRYVGDADESLDLVQETFVAAWEALPRYDRKRAASPWLRRIALNKCRDWGRRRAVRRFFYGAVDIEGAGAAAQSAIEDPGDITGALDRLDAAIAALPAALKEPLLLTVFDGLSHLEAGAVLKISAKAVETRLYRARKALAEALGDAPPNATET